MVEKGARGRREKREESGAAGGKTESSDRGKETASRELRTLMRPCHRAAVFKFSHDSKPGVDFNSPQNLL